MAAQVTISNLPQGLPLTGTEAVPVVQNGLTIKATTQDIANLAGGGVTNVSSFNTRTGAVTLLSSDVTGALGYTPGSVTSVGGTGTVSGLTLSGSVSTTGDLTLGGTLAVTPSDFASQTANTVLAAPNGTAGAPTFRAIVAADIPTLNQNTTGTAANVTGTVAIANGGTGATTAPTARTSLGATTLGGNLFTLANVAAVAFPRFNADNTVSSLDAASFRTAIGAGTSSTTGTVTSVGIAVGTGMTVLGSPITTSGSITLGLSTKLVAIENLSGAGFFTQNGSGAIAGRTITAGTGVNVQHGNGSSQDPIIGLATSYGDLINPYASKTANTFLAAPNGAAGVPTFRAMVAADVPTLNQNTTGTAANVTGTVAIANGGTGATTLAGASIATYAGAETLTNKRINPRVSTTASTATLTPDISSFDQFNLTAQAAGLTVAAPTGTPVDGNKIMFRFLDNGTARAITWNATYTAIGVTLPTTTVISKMLYVGCIYNAANTRWDVIAVTQQA